MVVQTDKYWKNIEKIVISWATLNSPGLSGRQVNKAEVVLEMRLI